MADRDVFPVDEGAARIVDEKVSRLEVAVLDR